MEIWKDIKGYKGYYKVSNKGRIKSLGFFANGINNSKRFIEEKILNPSECGGGYKRTVLSISGERKSKIVHRLVANAFIPNPGNKPQVNHIDGDKSNNCVNNLEWCTPKENNEHAIKNGLINFAERNIKGENHGMAKLTKTKVLEIRKIYSQGNVKQIDLAKKYKVSTVQIHKIINRESWSHI